MIKNRTIIVKTLKTNSPKVIEISVSYNIGGMNYFSGKSESRGYYISVTPVEINGHDKYQTKVYSGWSGYKHLLRTAKKYSEKDLEFIAKEIENDNKIHQPLLDMVLSKNKLKLKENA